MRLLASFARNFGQGRAMGARCARGRGAPDVFAVRWEDARSGSPLLQAQSTDCITGGSMPRSTLRCAAFAGALCLTATMATASADAQTPAHVAKVGVGA